MFCLLGKRPQQVQKPRPVAIRSRNEHRFIRILVEQVFQPTGTRLALMHRMTTSLVKSSTAVLSVQILVMQIIELLPIF